MPVSLICPTPLRRSAPAVRPLATRVLLLLSCIAVLCPFSGAFAQGTPLRPPVPLQPPVSSPSTPAPASAPSPSSALTAPVPASKPATAGTTAMAANPGAQSLARFQTLKVAGKTVDLRTMANTDVLKGKNGRTISVARIKQLQARIDGASSTPMMVAKTGQSLKTLAAAPAGTRISLPGGTVARSQDMAKVQNIYAKLSTKRVIRPAPMSMTAAKPQAVVGQGGLTLADAMKRPTGEVIQVGTRKYTVEQLRFMDSQLKASKRDPRGLVDRAGTRAAKSPAAKTPAANLRDAKAGVGK